MQTLKTVLERNQKALELRPALGRISTATCVRLTEGLACEVEEGPWRLRVDMSEKSGGQGPAPNPGIYGRAALGSCLAIGYRMIFARHHISICSLQVEVQADSTPVTNTAFSVATPVTSRCAASSPSKATPRLKPSANSSPRLG